MPEIKDSIDQVLEKLRDALIPFVESAFAARYGTQDWLTRLNSERPRNRLGRNQQTGNVHWSPDDLLNTIVIGHWSIFKTRFRPRSVKDNAAHDDYVVKGWIEELLETRKRAAHQEPLTIADVARFVDTAELLLRAAKADAAAEELHALHPYVEGTRLEYWSKNIESIIRTAEILVVLDSYQGHKHAFWRALQERMRRPEPFHLCYLILKKDDPFLTMCLNSIDCPPMVTDLDLELIDKLIKARDKSPHKNNKHLEFFYWEGFSPGPLLAWKKAGMAEKETIALGFWLQVEGATNHVPYIAVSKGPLFEALKEHYHHIVEGARSKADCRIHSPTMALQNG